VTSQLHLALGLAAVAIGIGLAVDGLRRLLAAPPTAAQARGPGAVPTWQDRLRTAFVLVIVITAAGGLGLYLGGARPRDGLHFVYAVVALLVLPAGDWVAARRGPRTAAVAALVTALVALVVIWRLFQTGG
jgi:hypothetical protein